jgi:hypothetical protein
MPLTIKMGSAFESVPLHSQRVRPLSRLFRQKELPVESLFAFQHSRSERKAVKVLDATDRTQQRPQVYFRFVRCDAVDRADGLELGFGSGVDVMLLKSSSKSLWGAVLVCLNCCFRFDNCLRLLFSH